MPRLRHKGALRKILRFVSKSCVVYTILQKNSGQIVEESESLRVEEVI